MSEHEDGQEWPKPIDPPDILKDLADSVGGTIGDCAVLPDGSGFAVMSMPLPKDHWLTADHDNVPPMPYRLGTDSPFHQLAVEKIREAAKYAIRASTMNGAELDFDPDAMVQNFVTGLLGYWTPTGLSSDDWANPPNQGQQTAGTAGTGTAGTSPTPPTPPPPTSPR